MAAPVTRIDAIRYARHDRHAAANFAAPVDDHDLAMPLDYYVWAIHREGAPPIIVARDIHAKGCGRAAGAPYFARDRRGCLAINIADDDLGPIRREALGNCGTDAAPAADDKRHAPFKRKISLWHMSSRRSERSRLPPLSG